MTKNEDVSWIPKIGRVSLANTTTTDLVAELCSREGVSMPFTIGEMYSVTINHEIEFMDPYEVCGPL